MMHGKKIRGKKRKLSSLIERINYLTEDFPVEQTSYWHMHLPVAQNFIDSPKTPQSIRRKCIQTLIDRTNHLKSIKPDNQFRRVVAFIDQPALWNSQIVIFYNKDYFNNFFIRDTPEQSWKPITDNRKLLKEWNLEIPNGLSIRGYHEIINDEYYSEGQIWAIGEL